MFKFSVTAVVCGISFTMELFAPNIKAAMENACSYYQVQERSRGQLDNLGAGGGIEVIKAEFMGEFR